MSINQNKSIYGFSLLELAAAVSVLGILSSIAIPRIVDMVNNAKIDSAKAKLNSTAVSCLQEIRQGANSNSKVNESILSDQILESDGYKISKDMNSCSSLMITSSDEKDTFFFDMGFTINDGTLIKFATPISSDNDRACKSWAGSNCKKGEDLKQLIAHNKAVQEAKTACNNTFYAWLNATPPGDGKNKRWDPIADSDCKKIPPANKGSTCSINGCNPGLETWAFEGTIVAGEDGWKQALESKYDKDCTIYLDKKREGKYTGGPEFYAACGASKEMWFHEGFNVGTKAEMQKGQCSDAKSKYQSQKQTGITTIESCVDNTTFYYCNGEEKGSKALMQECIDSDEEATCRQDTKKALDDKKTGEFIPNVEGPAGYCRTPIYLCPPKQYANKADFDSECKDKDPACSLDKPPNRYCTYSPYVGNTWWNTNCKKWADCSGYIY